MNDTLKTSPYKAHRNPLSTDIQTLQAALIDTGGLAREAIEQAAGIIKLVATALRGDSKTLDLRALQNAASAASLILDMASDDVDGQLNQVGVYSQTT